jgi:hypothetical protein
MFITGLQLWTFVSRPRLEITLLTRTLHATLPQLNFRDNSEGGSGCIDPHFDLGTS